MQSLYLYTVGKTFDREGISCCQVCLAEFNNDFLFLFYCNLLLFYYHFLLCSSLHEDTIPWELRIGMGDYLRWPS